MGRIWAWSYLPKAASIVHGRSFQRENFERTVMNRRRFLAATAVGAGAGISSVAMPAIAQSMPQIRWRLAASWPKSLDTLYGACEVFAKRVAEITDNRFQIQLFAAGEIVPGLAVLDAVQNQTVEIGHRGLLLRGKGCGTRLWHRRAIWSQRATDGIMARAWQWQRFAAGGIRELQLLRHPNG